MSFYNDSSLSPNILFPLIGKQIKALRIKNHMTQVQLADCIDGDQKQISKIEAGIARPNLITYLKIANVFHVSIDCLLAKAVSPGIRIAGTSESLSKSLIGQDEIDLADHILLEILLYLQKKDS